MTKELSYLRMRVSMPLKPWMPDQVGHDKRTVIPAHAGIHALETMDARSSRA